MNILQATMRPMQALMKQRVFILGILAIGLVACSDPKGKYEVAVDDDRYDLLALNMPPLLKSDAKSCIKVLNFVRDQDVGSDEVMQKMLETLTDFWQVVDVSMVSVENSQEVLPYGGNPKNVKSILPKGVKLPNKISHACGLYAGKIVAKIGLMSLDDGIDLALAEDPQIFTKMGLTTEDVKAGLSVISKQAKTLNTLPMDERVHCVAIYQAATANDKSLEPRLTVWTANLVDSIESNKLDPKAIKEKSLFWRALAKDGSDAVISADGFQEQATKCDEWIDDAVASQAAN